MPARLDPGVLETATMPSSSGPMNLMFTPSPPVLTFQLFLRLALRFNQEHLNSPTMGLASPLGPTTMQMPLREVQHGQIKEEIDICLPAFYHHRPPKIEAP
jgi:hypothetical protein